MPTQRLKSKVRKPRPKPQPLKRKPIWDGFETDPVTVTGPTHRIGNRLCSATAPIDKMLRILDGADAVLTDDNEDAGAVSESDAQTLRHLLGTLHDDAVRVQRDIRSLAGVLGADYWGVDLPPPDKYEQEIIDRAAKAKRGGKPAAKGGAA